MVMFSTTWPPPMYHLAQEFMDPYPVKVVVGSEDLAANHDVNEIVKAMTPEYKSYQEQVLSNCLKFAKTLVEKGYELVSGGTENHLVPVNLKNKDIDGLRVEKVLESVHIAANKKIFPGDVSAMVHGGIRMKKDFAKVAEFFDAAVQLAVKIKAETKGNTYLSSESSLDHMLNMVRGLGDRRIRLTFQWGKRLRAP